MELVCQSVFDFIPDFVSFSEDFIMLEGKDLCSELFFDHGSDCSDRITDLKYTIYDRLIVVLDSKYDIESDSSFYIIYCDTIDSDIEIHQGK